MLNFQRFHANKVSPAMKVQQAGRDELLTYNVLKIRTLYIEQRFVFLKDLADSCTFLPGQIGADFAKTGYAQAFQLFIPAICYAYGDGFTDSAYGH